VLSRELLKKTYKAVAGPLKGFGAGIGGRTLRLKLRELIKG
jgi:hypothetical protein